jgi:hypothetical protein
MSLSKSIASVVSQPDVIALVYKCERGSKFGIISYPKVHVTEEAMHHKHCRLFDR